MNARSASLSLAADRGIAAWSLAPGGAAAARTAEFTFDAAALAAGDESVLADALQTLWRVSQARELHVALASPWATPRVVALPPLRTSEARTVLQRDAARHFPVVRTEPVVAARALPHHAWLACDADGVVLDAIARAARAAGFTAVRVVAAAAAWAHAAATATDRAYLVGDEATLLSARGGHITSLRRCRTAEVPRGATAIADALGMAAQHAPHAAELELVSASERTARADRARRTARGLGLAGLCLLAMAAAIHARGAQQRVARIEARRAAMHAVVAPLTASRDSLTEIEDALQAITRVQSAPQWSARLVALARALPLDAYFLSVRGDADSVLVEGRAPDAAIVLERLRAAHGVREVRALASPVLSEGPAAFSALVWFGNGGTR